MTVLNCPTWRRPWEDCVGLWTVCHPRTDDSPGGALTGTARKLLARGLQTWGGVGGEQDGRRPCPLGHFVTCLPTCAHSAGLWTPFLSQDHLCPHRGDQLWLSPSFMARSRWPTQQLPPLVLSPALLAVSMASEVRAEQASPGRAACHAPCALPPCSGLCAVLTPSCPWGNGSFRRSHRQACGQCLTEVCREKSPDR